MIGGVIAQLVETAVANKKRAIGLALSRMALLLVGALLVITAFGFALFMIYHLLTPDYVTQAEAAAVIAVGLLVLGGILVLVALKSHQKPPSVSHKPELPPAELQAIEALGQLNNALADVIKKSGGASPVIGLLGLAALVGFVSGRKR